MSGRSSFEAALPNQLVHALTDSSSCTHSADDFLRAVLLGKRLRSAAVKKAEEARKSRCPGLPPKPKLSKSPKPLPKRTCSQGLGGRVDVVGGSQSEG